MQIPLTKPRPPKLSDALPLLKQIEDSNIFSNFGPVNTQFEADIVQQMFEGVGACTTTCNATLGLMIAIRHVIGNHPPEQRRYALMPSFTFPAAAHAAIWCGLTPLFCDINPVDWSADADSEERLLRQYGSKIAVVVPYATFGYDIDLARYEDITARYGVPVVVDAAASLGTVSASGHAFGTGFSGPIVFSMHVTKSFATAEGGIVYSADEDLIRALRTMSNFGFGETRNATMPGLNAKMSEVNALLAHLQLQVFDTAMERRCELVNRYRQALPEFSFQPSKTNRQAHQFVSMLLPPDRAVHRRDIQESLARQGVGSANYFDPHVAQQDYFRSQGVCPPLPVTEDVAARILTLPLFNSMTEQDFDYVVAAVLYAMEETRSSDLPTAVDLSLNYTAIDLAEQKTFRGLHI